MRKSDSIVSTSRFSTAGHSGSGRLSSDRLSSDRARAGRIGLVGLLVLSQALLSGCGGDSFGILSLGNPFPRGGAVGGGDPGANDGFGAGGVVDDGGAGFFTDPCAEPTNRKFVTVSMRNDNQLDFVHFFVVFIARVNDPTGAAGFVDGAVCPDDIALYQSGGYTTFIANGAQQTFGNYCIDGPALLFFFESGAFRDTTGALASGIEPASGALPSFNPFFSASGATIPVPNEILFHNPGTGSGAALQVSTVLANPCDTTLIGGTPNCSQDAFYYVSTDDIPAGSPILGLGSSRRVPNEIQGTQCQLGNQTAAFQVLAPAALSASDAAVNITNFFRGGRIEYIFIREDVDPPIPQLLWDVTDGTGAPAQMADPRATLLQ